MHFIKIDQIKMKMSFRVGHTKQPRHGTEITALPPFFSLVNSCLMRVALILRVPLWLDLLDLAVVLEWCLGVVSVTALVGIKSLVNHT